MLLLAITDISKKLINSCKISRYFARLGNIWPARHRGYLPKLSASYLLSQGPRGEVRGLAGRADLGGGLRGGRAHRRRVRPSRAAIQAEMSCHLQVMAVLFDFPVFT